MSLTGEKSELNLIEKFSKMEIVSPRKSTENNEQNEETILPTELEELESVNINGNEFKIVNDLEDHDNTENSKHDFIDLKQIIK